MLNVNPSFADTKRPPACILSGISFSNSLILLIMCLHRRDAKSGAIASLTSPSEMMFARSSNIIVTSLH